MRRGNTIGPDGAKTSIYDASIAYQQQGVPLIVLAGHEYGTVPAAIGPPRHEFARSEGCGGAELQRIHRSNLVGMGVLRCQFAEGTNAQTLKLDGTETHDIVGLDASLRPVAGPSPLRATRKDGTVENIPVRCRIDTPIEIEYYQHGAFCRTCCVSWWRRRELLPPLAGGSVFRVNDARKGMAFRHPRLSSGRRARAQELRRFCESRSIPPQSNCRDPLHQRQPPPRRFGAGFIA